MRSAIKRRLIAIELEALTSKLSSSSESGRITVWRPNRLKLVRALKASSTRPRRTKKTSPLQQSTP